jgi:ABC-2 type transport system ATP-binding protein/lipopolysaccharide transport system ATP-binding protein
MHSVEVDRVSKLYRLGEAHRSTLRDAIVSTLPRRGSRARNRRELWALRDVSFAVDDGEVVGIIGRNGAGKSTLLRILSRITEPTSGASRTRGRVGALLEVGTGFHPELTGRENIFLNGAVLGMRRAEIRRRFDEIVSFAGIEKFLETPIKRYSSGMYLRLAFSVAAHLEPDIVVVDEVLAVGDAEFQRKSLGKMSEFAREGRTVLFVSHDLGAVARICKRGIWLDQGNVSYDGPVNRGIELYLDARGERASFVEFPLDTRAAVQLLAAGVTSLSGAALDSPRRDEPFAVRVRVLAREPVRGLDVKIYLLTRKGVRVLDENLLDRQPGEQFGGTEGEWEVSVVVPPLLTAGDYVLGASLHSPYQTYFDEEVLSFRLWPPPDERQESIDRNRIVQPEVEWRVERRPGP